MLEAGDYGGDDVPDVFATNHKVTDIVSHQHGINSQRMRVAVQAQDAALGRLVSWLDENAGDYALIITADHGNTPRAEETGAWPVLQRELARDIDRRFDVPRGRSLVEATTAVGPFLDLEVMDELDVTREDVARFLNGYTVAENWSRAELPAGYEDRGHENVFSAAFAKDQLDEVLRCRFGRPRPPAGSRG